MALDINGYSATSAAWRSSFSRNSPAIRRTTSRNVIPTVTDFKISQQFE